MVSLYLKRAVSRCLKRGIFIGTKDGVFADAGTLTSPLALQKCRAHDIVRWPTLQQLLPQTTYGRRDAVTVLASGSASASAIAAQFVAALEIH